jgi:long-chain fatty acid transport protein
MDCAGGAERGAPESDSFIVSVEAAMYRRLLVLIFSLSFLWSHTAANAQSFGVELFNNVMPASGGMAGTSIAAPQDVQSAVYGNPATMTQYKGNQFAFGSAWVEPTYNLSVAEPGLPLLGIQPFSNAKSDAQGVAPVNIGITHDLSASGLPVTFGLGFMAGSGAGVDFRHVPQGNGTNAMFAALDVVTGAGIDLTERLSVGASMVLSNATLDGPFVGFSGSSADYALRGTIGFDYALREDTRLGLFWKTKASYTFRNSFRLLPGSFLDVSVDRPECVGFGVSNSTLMDGRLLLAADVIHQQYTETAMFGALFRDQWSLQLGSQYTLSDRVRLRLGYAWNENPMRDAVGDRLGGVLPPGGVAHVQYIEALFAAIPQHRVTGGLSVRDVLPGVDLDLLAGGMFAASQTFGITTAEVESYWVGAGFTWRYGQGACGDNPCQ